MGGTTVLVEILILLNTGLAFMQQGWDLQAQSATGR